jgi:hypothetical protein
MQKLLTMINELKVTKSFEDDAMFTKKYVGPVDCASCERGLVNLQGKQAEKVHWNKLPFREPGERIARVRNKHDDFLVRKGIQLVLASCCYIGCYDAHHERAQAFTV